MYTVVWLEQGHVFNVHCFDDVNDAVNECMKLNEEANKFNLHYNWHYNVVDEQHKLFNVRKHILKHEGALTGPCADYINRFRQKAIQH